MTEFPPRRSLLYVPAVNARAIEKARTLACDAVILDLEDSVAPEQKAAARDALTAAVREGGFSGRELLVRVNGLDTPWGSDDFGALIPLYPQLTGVVAPKVADAQAAQRYVARLMAAPDRVGIWAMIETCRGLLQIEGIAAARRVHGLIMGFNDLAAEMGARPGPGREPFQPAMMMAVAAARAHGIQAFDGVCNDLDDPEAFEREARQAKSFGFDGKTLIHPKQIEPCNRAFAPSAEEAAWARAVVDAFAANPEGGALRVEGKMVEKMHLAQARRTLVALNS